MVLIPYRSEYPVRRWPWMSLLIVVVFVGLFYVYQHSQQRFEQAVAAQCTASSSPMLVEAAERLRAVYASCEALLSAVEAAGGRKQFAAAVMRQAVDEDFPAGTPMSGDAYVNAILGAWAQAHAAGANPVERLLGEVPWLKRPAGWLGQRVAPRDWVHVAGDVLVFLPFAIAVEMVIGAFGLLLLGLAVVFSVEIATLAGAMYLGWPPAPGGLSYVVAAIVAVFIYLLPDTRIYCLFWSVVSLRRVVLSPWLWLGLLLLWETFLAWLAGLALQSFLIAMVTAMTVAVGLAALFFTKEKWQTQVTFVPSIRYRPRKRPVPSQGV